MVTVDPNAAELVEFRLVLANDVIEGSGVLSEVTLTEFKPVT
jgi:hypothetical protein